MTNQLIQPDFMPEIRLRAQKTQALMAEAGIKAMLVADNANLYYLTGRFFRGYVFLPANGDPIYFVIRPDSVEHGENVVRIRKPEQIASELARLGVELPDTTALELDSLSYSEIRRLDAAVNGTTPDFRSIANASPLLREARMVKTPLELRMMKADGEHQAAVYRRVTRCYKSDMTDLEFQVEIERILRLEGCLGRTRVAGRLMEINMGSVISGENADTPSPYDFSMGGAGTDPALPVGADGKTMKEGTVVMVDMNGCFNGYQTDMTRVWRIGGISQLASRAHACSIRILRVLEKEARPGMEAGELYRRAEAIVEEEGLSPYFMGHRQKAGFIGHGVGIELNEQPALTSRCQTLLKEDMTLALEPKFVIPEVGAVGVENTYRVTADGLENLTPMDEEIIELI